LLESGELSAAEEMFKSVLGTEPSDIEAHRGLAEVYSELGANTRVIEQLDIVAKLDPQDSRPWLFKACFHADLGNFNESVIAYEEALARSETPEQIGRSRIGLAESLLKHGQHLRAQEVLANLPDSFRAAPQTLVLKAEVLAPMGDYSAARQMIEPVVSGPNPSSAALTLAGRIEFETGCDDRAIKYLEVASYDPSQFEARYLLAQALNRTGRNQTVELLQSQADLIRTELQQLSRLAYVAGARPWDRTVRERLAEISGRLGKKDIAEKWRRAAKVCPPPSKS
jgi:Tfp pilus assembly protein PilF